MWDKTARWEHTPSGTAMENRHTAQGYKEYYPHSIYPSYRSLITAVKHTSFPLDDIISISSGVKVAIDMDLTRWGGVSPLL